MISADVYALLNDIFVEALRFIFILALIILAIFLGAKLRKAYNKKKEAQLENQPAAMSADDSHNE